MILFDTSFPCGVGLLYWDYLRTFLIAFHCQEFIQDLQSQITLFLYYPQLLLLNGIGTLFKERVLRKRESSRNIIRTIRKGQIQPEPPNYLEFEFPNMP